MTGKPDAPSRRLNNWKDIPWECVTAAVNWLQMRIAKATQAGDLRKSKALQWLLTHSYYARLLAIKRVVESKGSKTPGVDGEIWNTSGKKMKAIESLKRRGYKPQALRRIYIPKNNGKLRPLSIPCMLDRAQQALYLLALAPVAETLADINSYGFREGRSCHDAIEQCFTALSRKPSAQWILEGDIKSCFDKISHDWMLKHIPTDTFMLQKWLKVGFLRNNEWFPTTEGTAQGGVISPCVANMVLDGLETAIKSAVTTRSKVNYIRYADDFIVTGGSKEILEDIVKPVIHNFLKERGLELSEEKTKITHIQDGFDFLGQNIRKYGHKLLIKPSKANIKRFMQKLKEVIRPHRGHSAAVMIRCLNSKIRGWTNYHQHVVSKVIFSKLGYYLHRLVWLWARREHSNKSASWIVKKYFTRGSRRGRFCAKLKATGQKTTLIELFYPADTPITRHVKVKGRANPYDISYLQYFKKRKVKEYKNIPAMKSANVSAEFSDILQACFAGS